MFRRTLIASVLALLALAASKGPPPAPLKPSQPEQSQAAPKEHDAEPYYEATERLTAAVDQLSAEVRRQSQQTAAEHNKPNPPIDWWSRGNTLAVTFFTGVLAIVAILQWCVLSNQHRAMVGQYRAMLKQLREMKTTGKDTRAIAEAARTTAESSRGQLSALEKQAGAFVQAANAAVASNQLTINLFTATKRPWVSAEMTITDAMWRPDGGLTLTMNFVFKNTGESPALDVYVSYRLVSILSGEISWNAQRKLSEEQRQSPVAPAGLTVFPGDHPTLAQEMGYSKDEIARDRAQWLERYPDASEPGVMLSVVGCISYHSVFSTDWYQTGFIFDIFRHDPERPGIRALIPVVHVAEDELIEGFGYSYSFFGNGATY